MSDPLLGFEPEQDEAGGGGILPYLPVIIWQRKWWIIVPVAVSVLAAAAAAVLIPPRYKASAVMLVQAPQLPEEVIGQFNDSVIERRIAAIRAQVTSRPALVELIDRHGLYADRRATDPLSEVIEDMREAITLTPSTVELPNPGAGQSTITFELAFEYGEAAPAQAAVQDLMDKILDLNASGSLEQATNTAQFLQDQARQLETQIQAVEGQIAAVNARYGSVLGSTGAVIGSGAGSYDVQIAALQRDNANLIAQKNMARTADTRDPVVVGAETALAAARASYSESHPDVVLAKQRLEEARALARNNTERLPLDTIDQQIAFNNSQIAELRAAKTREQTQISSQLASQARAPLVQQQVAALQQRLEGLNQQYERVQERVLSAQAGVRAEDEQMGQRLAVVEPPVIPDEPVWPNRLLILAGGLAAGLGLGIVLAAAVELLLRPIRDPRMLSAIARVPSLGVIPPVPSGRPAAKLRLTRRRQAGGDN